MTTRPPRVERLESRALFSAIPGDADLNGTVDVLDYTSLAAHFNQRPATWANGDFNADGGVDLTDFTILAAHFGQTAGVTVHVGERIQPVIDAHPGETVHVDPGTYDESLNVHDCTLDGPGVVVTNAGRATAMTVTRATVRGVTLRGCANQLQNDRAAVRLGDDATLADVTVEKMDATGICVQGHRVVLLRVTAQDNGEAGIGGDGCADVAVTDCVTRRNNRGIAAPVWAGAGPVGGYTTTVKRPDGLWYVSPDFEAGGGKWWKTSRVTITRMRAYDNGAPGIWFDYQNSDATVRDSTVYGNAGWQPWHATGIRLELSDGAHGRYTITGNTINGHAGGDVSVEQVSHVAISGNTLSGPGIGVLLRDYDRGAQYRVGDVSITGNTFNQCNVTWWENPFGTAGVSVHDNVFVV